MASSSFDSTNENTSAAGYLPRGGACVSCRRRKMKCDGRHPICTQCDRAGRAEDCEYTAGQERSTVQILEENISRLEARIQELQNPDVASTSVVLRQPYGAEYSSRPNPSPSISRVSVQDPPRQVAEILLAGFFQYSAEIGFFLNLPRFRASMMQGYQPGHPSRPAPSLIYTVYLWSIRLSNDPSVKSREAAYLFRATQDAATALSSTHPHRILHSIQTEVLLATYFFANGRFFEGKYHAANAVSTVLSTGMHKIRSASPGQLPSMGSQMPIARDSLEEGERIIATWTVFNMDKMWATALEHTPNFEESTHTLGTRVDTPWPLEMEEFEQGVLPPHALTSNTIQNFLTGIASPDLGLSSWAFLSKAVILWDRAASFVRKCSANPASQLTLPPLFQEFTSLCALIDNLLAQMPSVDPQAIARMPNAEQARRTAVGYTILKAATIKLHAPFAYAGRSETSRQHRVSAARVILEIVIALSSRGSGYLNPIVGTPWIEASQVLYDEIALIRATRLAGTYVTTDDRAILALIQHGVNAMADFALNIPLTSFQVGKIQESYQAI